MCTSRCSTATGKSLASAQSQLQFKVSVTEPSDAFNAGMAKQTRDVDLRFCVCLCPQLALWLIRWLAD